MGDLAVHFEGLLAGKFVCQGNESMHFLFVFNGDRQAIQAARPTIHRLDAFER